MKVGTIPVASISLLIVVLIKLFVKYLAHQHYFAVSAYLDGALMGIVLIYVVYYLSIFITAVFRNRREELQKPKS